MAEFNSGDRDFASPSTADHSDDDEDNGEHDESPLPVLTGPYAHLYLADLQRQLQSSVNAGKKALKNNKRMSYKATSSSDIEPPKHHPPANPLPADNLKSCMKKDQRKGKKARRKVTWAPDVYDPAPCADSHAAYSKTDKSEYKKKDKGKNNVHNSDVSDDEYTKKGERVIKGGSKGGKHKEKIDEGSKGGKHKEKIDEGSKGGKHKEKIDEGSKGGKQKEKIDDGSKGGKGKGKKGKSSKK